MVFRKNILNLNCLDMEQIYPGTQVGDGFFLRQIKTYLIATRKENGKEEIMQQEKQISNP